MARDDLRAWLEGLEQNLVEGTLEDPSLPLAFGAGPDPGLPEDELRGAVRRAMLLLATGGAPQRSLELDGRAVTALASDLARADPTDALLRRLEELERQAAGLPLVSGALAVLSADAELAWRSLAAALLVEELSEA